MNGLQSNLYLFALLVVAALTVLGGSASDKVANWICDRWPR